MKTILAPIHAAVLLLSALLTYAHPALADCTSAPYPFHMLCNSTTGGCHIGDSIREISSPSACKPAGGSAGNWTLRSNNWITGFSGRYKATDGESWSDIVSELNTQLTSQTLTDGIVSICLYHSENQGAYCPTDSSGNGTGGGVLPPDPPPVSCDLANVSIDHGELTKSNVSGNAQGKNMQITCTGETDATLGLSPDENIDLGHGLYSTLSINHNMSNPTTLHLDKGVNEVYVESVLHGETSGGGTFEGAGTLILTMM